MSKILFVILGSIIALLPLANSDARETGEPVIDVMVGWNFPNSPGVQIFSPPKKNKYYHVLTALGEIAYVGKALEKLEDDLCLGKKKKNWYVPPGAAAAPHQVPSSAIIIASNARIDLKPVAIKSLDLDQKLLSNYASKIVKAEKLANFAYDVRNVGYKKETWRVAIILGSRKDRAKPDELDRIVVSVADIVGDNILERYRYRKSRGDSGDLVANLAAMADIDQDGLADVLLFDQGDFQGKMLLIEKGNKWHEQRDNWGEPC